MKINSKPNDWISTINCIEKGTVFKIGENYYIKTDTIPVDNELGKYYINAIHLNTGDVAIIDKDMKIELVRGAFVED